MNSFKFVRLALAAVCVVSFAAPARAADDEPAAVKKFKKTVESQAKTVLRIAHPLGKYKDVAFDGHKEADGKHELTYTVNWTGKENKEEKDFATTFTFTVRFDKDDAVDELAVAVAKDTCPTKAFKGADVVAGVFRAQVKKRVADFTDDKAVIEKIDKMDGDGLLAVWIKYADRKPKK